MLILFIVCEYCIQKKFPIDNLAEWNNGHPLGLRTVHAYVLVFDMGNLETFQYCRTIRDQILESFNHRDFSLIVVGNKYDLVPESNPFSQVSKIYKRLYLKIIGGNQFKQLNI